MNALSRLHAAALVYSTHYRWSVFPLQPRRKEPRPGFPVRTYQRERRATEQEIARWWQAAPSSNVALATGAISDFFVVDCDTESAYRDVLARGVPVETLTAKTGKGYHLYFQYPEFPVGNRAKMLPGVDVRGDGGYVVAPPSIHPSGARYQWANRAPIARAPIWLLQLLKKEMTPTATPLLTPAKPLRGNPCSDFASVALNREIQRLSSAADGQRNNALNCSAFCLGQLVSGGELEDIDVIAALWDTAMRIGLPEREAMPTILSGLNAGKRYPRTRFRRTVLQ